MTDKPLSSEQQQTEAVMRILGDGISAVLNVEGNDYGYALVVFKFDQAGIGNYISNAQRDTMIEALKELTERLEKSQDMPAGIGGLN